MMDPTPETPPLEHPPSAPIPSVADNNPAADGWQTGQWQQLPARARKVFIYAGLLVAIPLAAVQTFVVMNATALATWRWPVIAALWLFMLGGAVWLAHKRYRYTFWKLDVDGFGVRRGRLWQWETVVPTSRVQHLDLKRGPLERHHGLASLVLHTAGTRLSAVSISGLEDTDAERVRDHFSHEIDRHDDDDHA